MNIYSFHGTSVKTLTARNAIPAEKKGRIVSGRVTIKSIARDLGISHMTVSRALTGHPNVQKATRDAVLRSAHELGYVRNAAARTMRGGRTRIVGLLLPNIVNEFYARFANAMALACEDASLQLIIHLTGDDPETETMALARLSEIQADGVVMVPAPGAPLPGQPATANMTVVHLIRTRDTPPPDFSVQIEDDKAIAGAVAHLVAKGHSRIAYVGADQALSSGRARATAFQKGIRAANLPDTPELIFTGDATLDGAYSQVSRLLETGAATALVCGGFELSSGALKALMEGDALRGKGFGFVGYGDPSFYSWIGNGLTTVAVPVEPLARRAVGLLADPDQPSNQKTHRFTATLRLRDQ